MEKDLYQGRRWDPRKGKQGQDKKVKPIPSKKFANDALSVLNKSMKEAWVVKKGTEVVSKHKTKDEADVKAMKHPLYKVFATEEVAHSVHVKTYDSQGEKQMNSPEFKKHIEAHGGKLDYASDKGAAFKFASHSHAAAFHRGVQSKFKELDSEHDVREEVAVNAAGAGNVAGLGIGPQGEPGKSAKLMKKPLKRFKKFMEQ